METVDIHLPLFMPKICPKDLIWLEKNDTYGDQEEQDKEPPKSLFVLSKSSKLYR